VASHRIPRGTYVRDTLDWFGNRVGVGAAFDSVHSPPFYFSLFSLYNNSNAGESLYVYNILANFPGGDFFLVDFAQGTSNLGSFFGNCTSNSTVGAQPPGQVYLEHLVPGDPNEINPFITSPIMCLPTTLAVGGATLGGQYFEITPGWAIRLSNTFTTNDNSCTFVFVHTQGGN
jgi:hypothetical protein